jgi:GTP cyclohydrolase II
MSGHEGRGIGLWAKAATYLLQDQGENTYQANRSLGLSEDSRNFSDAATLIKYFLGNKPFRLLTNNPKKINDLKNSGLDNIAAIKHVVGVTDTNLNYLSAKRDWGHHFEKGDLGEE